MRFFAVPSFSVSSFRFAALLTVVTLCITTGGSAQNATSVPRVPPAGIAVPPEDRTALETDLTLLNREIEELSSTLLKDKPGLRALLPDVIIFRNAIHYALTYEEFFEPADIKRAKELAQMGLERARALRAGNAPWTAQTGLVVRGYVSRLDGSVQPYGLIVPEGWRPGDQPRRLDIWFHGRDDKLSEVRYLADRLRNPGQFVPAGAFVLHPYGRFCNANKLAGEVDTFEALDHIRQHYAIDANRILVRGFSMGGAACWQFAVHFPGLWAGAAPGAGFCETPDFLKVYAREQVQPTWWEKKLYGMYDCPNYTLNLSNLPTVAYSGEKDVQKQAADTMAAAFAKEGMSLVHVIGKNADHFYTPEARAEINRRMDAIAAQGRNPVPRRLRFTTQTLHYSRMAWVQLEALQKHWETARVEAEITDATTLTAKTQNVTALTVQFEPGQCPLDLIQPGRMVLDGQKIALPVPKSDRSLMVHFRKEAGRWKRVESLDTMSLHKRPGLQGPIDDAFMDSFLMVAPSGTPMNAKVGAWVKQEMEHAQTHWRRQFRGEARVKSDAEVSEADMAAHHLVLWGDPQSNRVLAKIAAQLPIAWDASGVRVGKQQFAAGDHVPVLIFPNPLNPKRYVVVNSGFTYREYDYLNNARQVPKLPDWAVLDINTPPDARWPGKVVEAGFFNERWQLSEAGQ